SSLSAGLCVRYNERCPVGHHPENEPMICRDMGFPPEYHELCVPYPGAPECVEQEDQCPKGTHAEGEPDICRDMGWPKKYDLLCVRGSYSHESSHGGPEWVARL
ncbi:hypothetical protein BGZ73_008591, partial [Actinomortierella ambigua]